MYKCGFKPTLVSAIFDSIGKIIAMAVNNILKRWPITLFFIFMIYLIIDQEQIHNAIIEAGISAITVKGIVHILAN